MDADRRDERTPPLSATDYHVLMVLTEEDLYGYAIMKAVEQESGGAVSPEIGSLYRILARLMPDEPEALGLLALVLLHDARRVARTSPTGDTVLLEDQDRTLWDRDEAEEGREVLERALRMRRPGSYQLQAAIAAVHSEADEPGATDWPQIVALYDALLALHRSPVVALNRAVAVTMVEGPARGLELVEEIGKAGALDRYLFYHSAKADLLRRLGHMGTAKAAYEKALSLAGNASERRFLEGRLRDCQS